MSKWWLELCRIMGMKLLMSTSFHPQMDGTMERANRSIGWMFWACNELEALNNYLTLNNIKDWQDLPKRVIMTS